MTNQSGFALVLYFELNKEGLSEHGLCLVDLSILSGCDRTLNLNQSMAYTYLETLGMDYA